ncbi:MAG: exosortase/archaeosortase family protein [Methanobacteriota archaeon]|nr:MAG: exosortase/archaeosortase family protein [Euryarchaeota archaeon]
MLRSEWLLLFGSLLVAGALYNHYMGHSALLIELVMVGIGTTLAVLACRSLLRSDVKDSEGALVDFLSRYIRKDLCGVILSIAGFTLILLWSLWKIVFIGRTDLRMEDFIVTLLGLSLVVYSSERSRLGEVKDFIVLYLLFLTIVFVVIWRTYSIVTGESYYRVTAYAEYYVVTMPVTWVLTALGFHVNAILDLDGIGLSNIIEYEYNGVMLRVGIGVGCSGLYSAGLFFSAFLAFVIARYRRVDAYTFAGLLAGFAVTWMANITRMVVTVMAGIAWGHPALVTVHSYIGIIIFVVFITIFWVLIVRWLDRRESQAAPPQAQPSEKEMTEGSRNGANAE